MLVIRPEQFAAFSAATEREFEARMLEHVRSTAPDAYAERGADGVKHLVRAAIDKSRSFGIRRERDVERMLDIMVAHGESFEREGPTAWTLSVLTSAGLSPSTRVELIRQDLTQNPVHR